MQRIREGLKTRIRSFVTQRTGLDEMAVDDLATSTKLLSWEAVQIPERLRFSSRLAILLVGLFMVHPNQGKVLQLFGKYRGTAKV